MPKFAGENKGTFSLVIPKTSIYTIFNTLDSVPTQNIFRLFKHLYNVHTYINKGELVSIPLFISQFKGFNRYIHDQCPSILQKQDSFTSIFSAFPANLYL